MSIEVCGYRYENLGRLCGYPREYHEKIALAHDYQPSRVVPLPLDYEKGDDILERFMRAEDDSDDPALTYGGVLRKAIDAVVGVDE